MDVTRLLCLLALTAVAGADEPLMLGSTACDYVAHQAWDLRAPGWQPLRVLRDHGLTWARVGVTTRDCPELDDAADWHGIPWRGAFWSCRQYAARILRQAAELGMRLDVFLFLSHTAAHGGRQEPSPEWAELPLDQACTMVEASAYTTAAYFARAGLKVEVYEIGNEIERGATGCPRFAPDARIDWMRMLREDPGWLRDHVWRPEAEVLKAAIRGVKRADPGARILLHISTLPPPNDSFVPAFFAAMADLGVPFDLAGLSLYPRGAAWREWERFAAGWVARIGRPVVISEFSYPLADAPDADPLPDYPPTPEGQAAFVRAFLAWCRRTSGVAGAFWFYPDHVPGLIENPLPGLFLPGDPPQPAPALAALMWPAP
ncbi:MAG: glycosyl hydrolase 53 family protein [Armatimonadetes bacterium]|nr:glycosyl hydrolase 53 family protein [Armatimonadota bacterium]